MQINLLSIFKYENSFEKSVGYVFVQTIKYRMDHIGSNNVQMNITWALFMLKFEFRTYYEWFFTNWKIST